MFELILIVLLILANGLFSMSEMAVISARKMRLQQRAAEGNIRAAAALALAQKPGRFLSTVQVGITLIGIINGSLGGASIAQYLEAWLDKIPAVAPYSATISIVLVVALITYLSLLLGELIPKQIALSNPERIAGAVAGPMAFLSRMTAPLVNMLNWSSRTIVRLMGIKPSDDPPVTEDEVRIMISQGTEVGIFEPMEEEMVGHVFRLSDQRASTLITPRTEIAWIDIDDTPEQVLVKVKECNYSRFPVARDSLDEVLGFVQAKDLLVQSLSGEKMDVAPLLQPAIYVPESIPVFEMVERFKEAHSQIALVIDEYGILQGLVTVNDILEAILGDIPEHGDLEEPEMIQREDGSWLFDGMLTLDEVKDIFGLKMLHYDAEQSSQTLGGFMMTILGRIPVSGDHFELKGLRFEVVDMDSLRVDKVLVYPVKE